MIIAPSWLITTKFVGQIHIYLFITKDSSYFHTSPLVWLTFIFRFDKEGDKKCSSVKQPRQRFVTALKGPTVSSQEGESA